MSRTKSAPIARHRRVVLVSLLVFVCWGGARADVVLSGDADTDFGSNGLVTIDFGGVYDIAMGLAVGNGKIATVGIGGPSNRFAISVHHEDGRPDTDFGTGGQLIVDQTAGAAAVAWLPDGDLLIGPAWLGGSFGFMIGRLNPDGAFDPDFGSGGKTTVPMGSQPNVEAIGLQSDGKIVLGGYSYFTDDWKWALARFNANGTLDSTFAGGTVITDFGSTNDDMCYDIVIQSDDKIVAGGSSEVAPFQEDYVLARYNTNGTLDDTFGVDGKVVIPSGQIASFGSINGLALQSDGAILACGSAEGNSLVMRLNTNGFLDSTFGDGGAVIVPVSSSNDFFKDLVVDTQGRIIAAGSARIAGDWRQMMVRMLPDGTLDGSFGLGGMVLTDFGTDSESTYALAFSGSDRVLMAGNVGTLNVDNDFALSRYITDTGLSGETVEVSTTVDGEGSSSDGVHFTVTGSAYFIAVDRSASSDSEQRGILEFGLGGIPDDAQILSVTLQIDIAGLSYFPGESYPFMIVYGYPGDGVLSSADATMTADEVGVSIPIMTQDPLTISLWNLEYVESLAQGPASHLGLVLYAGREGHYAGFVSQEGAATFGYPAPKLSVEYRVLAPSDFDRDGDVDADDHGILAGCMTGPLVLSPCDADWDGDVDQRDFTAWQSCLAGPGIPSAGGCQFADFDTDTDVDLADYRVLQAAFTGAQELSPTCLPVDQDNDRDIDLQDFAAFQQAFTGS